MRSFLPLVLSFLALPAFGATPDRPNIVVIYADDIGYGDFSCYGATRVATPNVDRLARAGRRFTQAHATSATCTPSRYALLTGKYPWRRSDARVLPGDAPLLIEPDTFTLPDLLQRAGYTTGVVGKWHLGLGGANLDWNADIKPGPLELGFNSCFLMPATGDRVPCVYVENHRVVGLDPRDPITVNYEGPIGRDPTGKANPNLLRMHPTRGHDMTIVNGVSRIGYMSGGQSARWVDEDMADVFGRKVDEFLERNRSRPFFLFFATHDIHVPRVPHARFVGQSGLGLRGDALLEFDWSVGRVLDTLERLGLASNTIVILSSDNGPVVDDGYHDQSVEKLGDHLPAGPLRGGKYSAFEAGTRVPMILRWPGRVKPGVSDALFSQIDFPATIAALVSQPVPAGAMADSRNALPALTGDDAIGRDHLIEHASNGRLGVRTADWKYIEPGPGNALHGNGVLETGNSPSPQLYHLKSDPGEKKNEAAANPQKLQELKALLDKARAG
jgi:arylsulfatase A-like enzyme